MARGGRKAIRCAGPVLAALALSCLVNAQAAAPRQESALAIYQARDQRLQDIGWKLVSANAPFCDEIRFSIGLQLLDAAGFGDPAGVRAEIGLKGDFAVQTAARGSPAAQAGLWPNREIETIAGQHPGQWPALERLDWKRLKRAHDLVDEAIASDGAVDIALRGGNSKRVAGVPVCATRFELATGGRRALAEGSRVILGEDFAGFAYPEAELAAAIAHELAHNLLRHRAWLDHAGRKQRQIRLTEREADRLMPWLLANAGYDPAAATAFMRKWGPRHDAGIFRARTHDGWDERAAAIAAEVETVSRLLRETGQADWRQHFRREIDPS